ncbi:dioxygenase family protein [Massilia antarctica]|uniref:dioxygenase family protein n=1 Tax=Massilia antarctica TaxID=2765360 RepID=UPI0006BB64D0|nr:intradiol ring-cleavage dioxygenase [Massilia sp. H27-R4]MCY0910292.1 intradiol ring-cleavage dioxygenase [Massilia sp. H27-R4]CUI09353.1 Protocatechuate dioxygenase [Janthinobacterium sp. CG23_2]CUU33139.1 Protocatechuate dioxygenase [Janthinobacterium sp. CG23_2]
MERHDHSLAQDIQTMLDMTLSRRQSLRWLFASAAALPLAGCGGGDSGGGTVSTTPVADTGTTPATGSSASCAVIPEETGGPYPGDGTNSSVGGVANALILAGIVRPDIRASIAGATGVADGVPLTIKLQMVNVKSGCASLAGATVYLWHCDREGRYSMYTSGVTAENYLRGVQEADANGMLTFTTIFPGCYAGRMPHVHFEVYPSLAKSTSAANRIKTSQFGFPTSTLSDAYAASGYSASVRNLANISYATDNVFSDGTALQIAKVSGSASLGYVATLTVGVSL